MVTRYELRACEPGVRVRTELFHGGRDPDTFFLADAVYWGGREASSFTPLRLEIDSFLWTAVLATLIIGVVSLLMGWAVPDRERR